MTVFVESRRDKAWRQGRSILVEHQETSIAASGTFDIIAKIGIVPMILETALIHTDSPTVLWQTYSGTVFNDATGTELNPVFRHSANAKTLTTKFYAGSTISDVGVPITIQHNAIGFAGPGGNDFIEQEIISRDFYMEAGTNYLIRLTNNTAAAAEINAKIHMRQHKMVFGA